MHFILILHFMLLLIHQQHDHLNYYTVSLLKCNFFMNTVNLGEWGISLSGSKCKVCSRIIGVSLVNMGWIARKLVGSICFRSFRITNFFMFC